MTHYVALIHKDQGSDFGIMFPDFPGCISVGATMDEAIRNGTEALAFHVEGMRADGEDIPAARPLEQIKADKEDWIDWTGATAALVPLLPAEGRAVRLNITLDKRLLSRIDAVSTNRSAFLATAARALIERAAPTGEIVGKGTSHVLGALRDGKGRLATLEYPSGPARVTTRERAGKSSGEHPRARAAARAKK